jgi:OOP family OmpA-OmpF porin
MKTFGILLAGIFLSTSINTASAANDGNVYVGFSLSSLALDSERVVGVPTRSPGHTPKIGSFLLGYQFNDAWAVDLSFGTDISDNVDTNQFSVNGYRFFGKKAWKPYLSAGVSSFNIDDATDDQTEQIQAGFGVSGALSDNLEIRLGYQHSFDLGDESYNDDSVMVGLNWHFRKPRAVAVAKSVAPKPQPESVPMQKEVVDTFELQVQFDFDKSDIKTVYTPQFEEIAQKLNGGSDISMTIEGHTCSIGTEQYNQGLSERRGNAVKMKFVKDYGFSPDRISVKGYGETRPVADNNTLVGRKQNRRAIAVILRPRKKKE